MLLFLFSMLFLLVLVWLKLWVLFTREWDT